MNMINRKSFSGLVIAVIATACLGFASSGFHKLSRTDVNFTAPAKFENGNVLPAGSYRMVVSGNPQTPQVKFYKEYVGIDGMGEAGLTAKPSLTLEAKGLSEPRKNETTEVDSVIRGDVQVIKSIRPAGLHEELVFGPSGASASATSNR